MMIPIKYTQRQDIAYDDIGVKPSDSIGQQLSHKIQYVLCVLFVWPMQRLLTMYLTWTMEGDRWVISTLQPLLVGGLEHFYFSIYWELSSQLAFIFFRGVGSTTKQAILHVGSWTHGCLLSHTTLWDDPDANVAITQR